MRGSPTSEPELSASQQTLWSALLDMPNVSTLLLAGTMYLLEFIVSAGRRLLPSRSGEACGRVALTPLWQSSELPANLTKGTPAHIHICKSIHTYVTFIAHILVMSRTYIRNGFELVLTKRCRKIPEPCLQGHPVAFVWSLAKKALWLVSTAWTPKVGKIMAHQTGSGLGLCHLEPLLALLRAYLD